MQNCWQFNIQNCTIQLRYTMLQKFSILNKCCCLLNAYQCDAKIKNYSISFSLMLPTQRCPLCGLRGDNRGTYQTALQLHTHTVTLRGLLTFMRVLKHCIAFLKWMAWFIIWRIIWVQKCTLIWIGTLPLGIMVHWLITQIRKKEICRKTKGSALHSSKMPPFS